MAGNHIFTVLQSMVLDIIMQRGGQCRLPPLILLPVEILHEIATYVSLNTSMDHIIQASNNADCGYSLYFPHT